MEIRYDCDRSLTTAEPSCHLRYLLPIIANCSSTTREGAIYLRFPLELSPNASSMQWCYHANYCSIIIATSEIIMRSPLSVFVVIMGVFLIIMVGPRPCCRSGGGPLGLLCRCNPTCFRAQVVLSVDFAMPLLPIIFLLSSDYGSRGPCASYTGTFGRADDQDSCAACSSAG